MVKLLKKENNTQETSLDDVAPKGFSLKKVKKINKRKQKLLNVKSTVLFLVGFIVPTIMAFMKRSSLNTEDAFEKYYFYIFIGLIILDIILYLPIFYINKSLVRKNNHKKLLLLLLSLRKLEKLIMAIYSLSFIFYGLPKDSFSFSYVGIINILKSNILLSVLSLLSALTSLFSRNKSLINEVSSEILKINPVVEKYSYDKTSGDIIVKVYKRTEKKSLGYAIRMKLLIKCITLIISLGGLILLIHLLIK